MDVDSSAHSAQSSNSAAQSAPVAPTLWCAACLDLVSWGQWFSHEGMSALVCRPCVKIMWRDRTKLEEYNSFHEMNATFPQAVHEELARLHRQ